MHPLTWISIYIGCMLAILVFAYVVARRAAQRDKKNKIWR